MYALIAIAIFVAVMFIGLGLFLIWCIDQPETNPFIIDDKQKLDHDRVNEGYPVTTYREYSAMAKHSSIAKKLQSNNNDCLHTTKGINDAEK